MTLNMKCFELLFCDIKFFHPSSFVIILQQKYLLLPWFIHLPIEHRQDVQFANSQQLYYTLDQKFFFILKMKTNKLLSLLKLM